MAKTPWYNRIGWGSPATTGKVNPNSWLTMATSSFWALVNGDKTTVDYTKNDYDLFRAIYHASAVNGRGTEYLMAASLGKPVVNILSGFVVGKGLTINLDNPDGNTAMDDAEAEINAWIVDNMATVYDLVKFTYRDGDGFVYIDEMGDIRLEDAASVDAMTDPVTGNIIGYDIKETTEEVDPQSGNKTKYVYLRQYRKDSVRILKWAANSQQAKATVVYEQVYTNEAGNLQSGLAERKLPIIHYANEPEARAIYGNSEYQNLLVMLRNYSSILQNSTTSVLYNGSPALVMKGVKDPEALMKQSQDPDDTSDTAGKRLETGPKTTFYLNGEHSDVKFLQAQGIMDDTAKLLEIYFYLMVQGSETPEFAFGTAVSSSKASTSTQMPILVRKVERKQQQLSNVITSIVETLIEKKQLISDPVFLKLKGKEVGIKVQFPPIDDDDKTLTLATVQWAVEKGILSDKTALELILSDKIKNVDDELKQAAEDAKAAMDAAGAVPQQQDRLFKELLANQTGTGSTNPTPADNNASTATKTSVVKQMVDGLTIETVREMVGDYDSDDDVIQEFIDNLDPEVISEQI